MDDLDLSHSLWEEVAAIASGFDTHSSLDISEKKLAPPPNPAAKLCAAFSHVKSLYVSKMNLEWKEVCCSVTYIITHSLSLYRFCSLQLLSRQ